MQAATASESLVRRYENVRDRTREIFGLLAPEAFNLRPIALRHPIRFYEGHLASFNFGMLRQSGFAESDPQPELTALFSRGIDPLDEAAASRASIHQWPTREVVRGYVGRVEGRMRDAFRSGVDPLYLHTAIEHEEMHQETLIYLIHRLPHELKKAPRGAIVERGPASPAEWNAVDGGSVRLGAERSAVAFGWDNEFPAHEIEVRALEMQSRKVSNGDFLVFMEDRGYEREELWPAGAWEHLREQKIEAPPFWELREGEWFLRGLFEDLLLPPEWPVFASAIEAQAYARWAGARLLTEAEWHRAFESANSPDAERDNFDWTRWNPAPVSSTVARISNPGGRQSSRLRDAPVGTTGSRTEWNSVPPGRCGGSQLAGNGWEWTSTVFAGFPGFAPFAHYPGYSADFFDGRHIVLKGASPVTPAALVRPSFRNWFQDQYRHAYTAFRCARDV